VATKRTGRPLFGPDRICAVVAAPTAEEMMAQIRRALPLTRTIELRLDWLENQRETAALLAYVPALRSRAMLIATCRRREGGGKFAGTIARQLACLMAAGALGCQWCDLEMESVSRIDLAKLRRFFPTSRLLVSFHDFKRTPPNLHGIRRRLLATGADAVKIATECRSIADSLRVLKLARGRRNVIAVAMGEAGLPARVLALREGSALAYASVGPATAPGQLSLEEMKTLYRADRLDRRTKIYGVIANPVAHSLSPLLHNTGFAEREMNAVYLPFLAREPRDFLGAIQPLGIAGFSVTLPHKQKILRQLDGCEAFAEKIGAVNTVVVRNEKLYGSNTDCQGILEPLSCRMRIPGKRVLILGAGGAARAAAFVLSGAGAATFISSRRPGLARALARQVHGEAISRRHIADSRFDAIVNATPVGLHPHVEDSPLRASELDCRVVFDLVYRPLETKLLRQARRRGIQVISGVEMFLAQGLAQWELWHGERAPAAAMRTAVMKALKE
jgi:3-dehydroquinate dehydratase/shikimate dehydrogenase